MTLFVSTNAWASKKARDQGFDVRPAYFVYRFRGGDGLTYDCPVACDYFTPSRAADGRVRELIFPCPVCEMRAAKGLSAGGQWIIGQAERFAQIREGLPLDDSVGYEAGNQISVKSHKRDFDVADNLFTEVDTPRGKKQCYGLVVISGRVRCADCMDARDGRAFDVVFHRVGLAMPFSPLVGTIWTPTDHDVMR